MEFGGSQEEPETDRSWCSTRRSFANREASFPFQLQFLWGTIQLILNDELGNRVRNVLILLRNDNTQSTSAISLVVSYLLRRLPRPTSKDNLLWNSVPQQDVNWNGSTPYPSYVTSEHIVIFWSRCMDWLLTKYFCLVT